MWEIAEFGYGGQTPRIRLKFQDQEAREEQPKSGIEKTPLETAVDKLEGECPNVHRY
jgi:hypothetical protein